MSSAVELSDRTSTGVDHADALGDRLAPTTVATTAVTPTGVGRDCRGLLGCRGLGRVRSGRGFALVAALDREAECLATLLTSLE